MTTALATLALLGSLSFAAVAVGFMLEQYRGMRRAMRR